MMNLLLDEVGRDLQRSAAEKSRCRRYPYHGGAVILYDANQTNIRHQHGGHAPKGSPKFPIHFSSSLFFIPFYADKRPGMSAPYEYKYTRRAVQ